MGVHPDTDKDISMSNADQPTPGDTTPPKPAEVDPETGTDPDGTPTENPSG